MYKKIQSYIEQSKEGFESIPAERKEKLKELSSYVEQKLAAGEKANLTFICTHNSRRSHLGQIWAQTAAAEYGIVGINTYSGGTEATAFNPRAAAALERAGFEIIGDSSTDNPVYTVKMSADTKPMKAFSKKYTDESNPQKDFCAVMTCAHADTDCPVVFGCDKRVSVTYEDPKEFDGTEREEQMYDERCRQISTEMLWVFSNIAD